MIILISSKGTLKLFFSFIIKNWYESVVCIVDILFWILWIVSDFIWLVVCNCGTVVDIFGIVVSMLLLLKEVYLFLIN